MDAQPSSSGRGFLPKRGCVECRHCGRQNGNRAYACRWCHRLLKDASSIPPTTRHCVAGTKRSSSDVTNLVSTTIEPKCKRVYSVRVRGRGPDYRTFVSLDEKGCWECHYHPCRLAQDARRCSSVGDTPHTIVCEHIELVQTEELSFGNSVPLAVDPGILDALPVPSKMREKLSNLLHCTSRMVQRVSKEVFLVQNLEQSQGYPFGLVHVRFPCGPKCESASTTFHCTCSTFKRYSTATGHSGGGTTPRLSKRCVHFYICLWAFASNRALRDEFARFLSVNFCKDAQDKLGSSSDDTPSSSRMTEEAASGNKVPMSSTMKISAASPMASSGSTRCKQDAYEVTACPRQEHSVELVYHRMERIPEDLQCAELKALMEVIAEKNANLMVACDDAANQWSTQYAPTDTVCGLCGDDLGNLQSPGVVKSYLVTKFAVLPVDVKVKRCTRETCKAMHSYRTWKEGIFNVSNKLFVALDLFFDMRSHVQRGEPVHNCAHAILNGSLMYGKSVALSEQERWYLERKLYDGYYAFEALSEHDWNEAICGVCGVAPVFESGDGNAKNCTPIKAGQLYWPPARKEGRVDVEGWWREVEMRMVESAVFSKTQASKPIDATQIAPWIPPMCRSSTVVNTEMCKGVNTCGTETHPWGCPKKLAELIREGKYDPDQVRAMSASYLKEVCKAADIDVPTNPTKPQMLVKLEALHSFLLQGQSECHVFVATPSCSGGKVFKNCQHQVISGTKFIAKKESTRDHVDLLLSSKHWPIVYAVDMACDVVAHTEARLPEQSRAMWGDRRGCFERPDSSGIPQVVHIPELQDYLRPAQQSPQPLKEHSYAKAIVHPVTHTTARYIVGDRFHDGPKSSGHKRNTCKYHNMKWCPELNKFQSVTSEVINSKIKSTRLQTSSQQDFFHYLFYNRLMDHWHNLNIVTKQRLQMQRSARDGEIVVRDTLHRFVYVCAKCRTPGHVHSTCSAPVL